MNNSPISLRPKDLAGFKGKSDLKNKLSIFIESAKKRNTQLDHIILFGPAGVGKTTLAEIISHELGANFKVVQATRLKKVTDLTNFISMINENDVIFIDEIHALAIECEETLYSILEDFKIDIEIGSINNTKLIRVDIPKFTLIGATTNIGKISKPLEERFAINLYLDVYSNEEIKTILHTLKTKINENISDDVINEIAIRSKGVPRIAINLLRRVNDFYVTQQTIDPKEIFSILNIDKTGLDKLDLKYLQELKNKNLSLKNISDLLNIDKTTILNKIEPFLIRENLILITTFGRKITQKGLELITTLNASSA